MKVALIYIVWSILGMFQTSGSHPIPDSIKIGSSDEYFILISVNEDTKERFYSITGREESLRFYLDNDDPCCDNWYLYMEVFNRKTQEWVMVGELKGYEFDDNNKFTIPGDLWIDLW